MAFTLAVTPESSSGTQGVGRGRGGGGTLAEPPDIIPSTDLAGCISAWDGAGKKLQSALPGAVEIRTSCCLLFILWSHTLPKAVF